MTLFLVIPCYNEQEVLPETAKRLKEKMAQLCDNGKISTRSRVCFVDDGSKDNTWSIIEQLHREEGLFRGIKLSHNQGHQNALLAGLMTVKDECDAAISMDADLQDDIDAIDQMVDAYLAGNDIVYGVRSSVKKVRSCWKKVLMSTWDWKSIHSKTRLSCLHPVPLPCPRQFCCPTITSWKTCLQCSRLKISNMVT